MRVKFGDTEEGFHAVGRLVNKQTEQPAELTGQPIGPTVLDSDAMMRVCSLGVVFLSPSTDSTSRGLWDQMMLGVRVLDIRMRVTKLRTLFMMLLVRRVQILTMPTLCKLSARACS